MAIEFAYPGMESDSISCRFGFDGNEPKQIIERRKKLAHSECRIALALNTHYPEVPGGFYVNKSLFALVQEGLSAMDLFVVLPDLYQAEGTIICEPLGALEDREEYLVVTHRNERIGDLVIWTFDTGGGGCFYEGCLILDFVLREPVALSLPSTLREWCRKYDVRFEEVERS